MDESEWIEIGSVETLRRKELQTVRVGRHRVALTCRDGVFFAISAVCNHVGGPLGEGRLVGDYVECPWHYWKFHHATGLGEPGYEADAVPAYPVRVEDGRVLVDISAGTPRSRAPHAPHPLARAAQGTRTHPGLRPLHHGDDRGSPALQHVRCAP